MWFVIYKKYKINGLSNNWQESDTLQNLTKSVVLAQKW